MDNLNLVVMGKTGVGKSTLINAVLGEEIAATGSGQAVTKFNQVYTKKIVLPLGTDIYIDGRNGIIERTLNLYDTVGLEIDSCITQRTLCEIQEFIQKAKSNEKTNDMSLVWFCVNSRSNRFESYEAELLRNLSIEYEIPFVVVLTQSIDRKQGELEDQIRCDFPEAAVVRVLAKDYKLRQGAVPAYGVLELLQRSVLRYNISKVRILEDKLTRLYDDRNKRMAEMQNACNKCIKQYSEKAKKVGIIPVGCIPVVHGLCIAMIAALNKIVGINSSKDFASYVFTNAILGIIITPLMAVPLISSRFAEAYLEAVGNYYSETLMKIIGRSTDEELQDNTLMAKRIMEEMEKRRGGNI